MLTEKNYLGLTLIGEVRGEPIENIIGTACCIRNRVLTSKKSYKEVVLAKEQFSCWNENDPNFSLLQRLSNDLEQGNPIQDLRLRECLLMANLIVDGELVDNVKGAKNYVTQNRYNEAKARAGKQDAWILNMQPVVTLGHHIFLV